MQSHVLRSCLPMAIGVVGVLSALSVRAVEKPEPQPLGGKIQWVYDYEQGKHASRETGKPMFVVFRCER